MSPMIQRMRGSEMGRGMEIHCEACGFKKELMYGGGFLSCPDNPVTRDEILSGRYGKRPKRILEKHPMRTSTATDRSSTAAAGTSPTRMLSRLVT